MSPTRRLFLKQLGLGAGSLFLAPHFTALRAGETSHLPRSTPEAEGVSSAGILAFLAAIAASQHEWHSFVLARHGRVVAEGWWAPYAAELRHTMYSMSKSFTSTAVGLAVAEGRLTVDDKVLSFFPKDAPEQVGEHLAALRVKDLLTMSVGNEKEPTSAMIREENWVRVFLAQPITRPPGRDFLYNSAATYLCAAIVQQVTGEKLIDYLKPRLFDPLGIEGATWETCPRGIATGGWGLSVRTGDLAKFGQLYLQKGQWNGRQLLPAKWVEEATSFKIQQLAKPNKPKEEDDWQQGYAYQFWRCRHGAFRGDGAFGQYTIVMPEQDAVLAMTSECGNMQAQLDLVWEHLLPAMRSDALPADASAQQELKQTLAALALPLPKGALESPTIARVTGKVFQLESNDLGLRSVSLAFDGRHYAFGAKADTAEHAIACGLGDWVRGETDFPGTPPRLIAGGAPPAGTRHPLAASGAWKDADTFEMMWRFIETPHHDRVSCRFYGDNVEISFLNSLAFRSGKTKDQRPLLRGKIAG